MTNEMALPARKPKERRAVTLQNAPDDDIENLLSGLQSLLEDSADSRSHLNTASTVPKVP